MKRRKKKRYFFRKLIFFIICLLIVFFLYKSVNLIVNKLFGETTIFNNIVNNSNNHESLFFSITDKEESDKENISKIFEEGMSLSDFNSVLDYEPIVIEGDKTYKKIDYDFERKLHYSEIEDYLLNMANSEIVNLEIIGKSVDNRNIYGITVGSGKKVLYMDANVHAAEVASTLFLTRFLSEIINDYEQGNKSIKDALKDVKIALIPCMNPDGYEIYNFGIESLKNKDLWWYKNKDLIDFNNIKSNANGVDLNRNFPTQNTGMVFKGKTLIKNVSLEKTTSSTKYFNGYSVGSEPETKAAMYFMIKHYKNVYAYINLHSQGRVIYAGKPNLSKEFNKITLDFAKKVSKINGYVVHGLASEEVGEGNDGSVTDFMAELANGFIFSSKTGRLYTDKHIDNSCKLEYNYPVITMETMKVWSSNPSYFKDEYYNYGIRKLFYELLDYNF